MRTAQHLLSRSKVSLQTKLQEVIDQHKAHGFKVKHVDADVEFECLEDSMPSTSFDIAAADEHESVVERSTRTVKEGIACLVQQSPCGCTPALIVKWLVEVVIRNSNEFPAESGISYDHSPLTIVSKAPTPEHSNSSISGHAQRH